MSADDVIPADIIKAAEECVIHLPELEGQTRWVLYKLIAKAIYSERERCENLARRYSVGYEKAIGMYGSADKDSGRGRQEGHINAGREIADLIRISGFLPPAPKGGE